MAYKNAPLMTLAPSSSRVVLLTVVGLLLQLVTASEFPERECCDPVYPLPAVSASVTPDPPPSPSISSSSVTRPGQMKSIETLNCLVARQLCFEDPSCSPILETIPRVCGAEIVSCSTVTVTKCQAALRTLQAFPFFKPTCLCKEPLLDQECNSFRNFLFDHPCIFVHKKEKDPYPIDALPTCNHALVVCQKDKTCMQSYEDFKTKCKVRDGKCQMDDRDACHEAWTNIRFSPMFGCICPNNHMKKRCDRIFSLVNHNPCIVKQIAKENESVFEGGEKSPLLKEPGESQHLNAFGSSSSLFSKAHRPWPTAWAPVPVDGPSRNSSTYHSSNHRSSLSLCPLPLSSLLSSLHLSLPVIPPSLSNLCPTVQPNPNKTEQTNNIVHNLVNHSSQDSSSSLSS
ncbi:uncharacterized protein LOC111048987 isoform X2 [Nilaparvata lugens]|uniref:uncharacterized protein LOC111048987 isoform X2 n=1 Tax=Nilaparvata lugens TaxID=108931 RepID=UPI00193C995D|nr:uncharacterized protein LOC111048987 isoform X2 [Nilaparvata lugens]